MTAFNSSCVSGGTGSGLAARSRSSLLRGTGAGANRRLLEVEAGEQDAEYQHRVELIQRYRTTAERGFYRALNAAETLRKDRRRERWVIEALVDRLERDNARLRAKLGEQAGSGECSEAHPAVSSRHGASPSRVHPTGRPVCDAAGERRSEDRAGWS